MRLTPSIFYNPADDAEAGPSRKPEGGSADSPRMARMRSCVLAAMLIRSVTTSEAARLRRMKQHIMGLRLPPSRLAHLWSYAREEALMYTRRKAGPFTLTRAPVPEYTMPEWADGAWLVMRAALSLLVTVPLADERDADAFTEIVLTAGYVLPKRQQRRAISIARRYVACAIKDEPFAVGGAQ